MGGEWGVIEGMEQGGESGGQEGSGDEAEAVVADVAGGEDAVGLGRALVGTYGRMGEGREEMRRGAVASDGWA